MTEQAFVDRSGKDWRWRWHVNDMADKLAGIWAKEAICQASYQAMLSVDRLASTLTEFLAERAEKMFNSAKSDFCKYVPQPQLKFNKRKEVERLLQNDSQQGHQWKFGSQSRSNMTAKCSKCGLYIAQTDNPEIFTRVLSHPCVGTNQPPPQLGQHESHRLAYIGQSWKCKHCQKQLQVRHMKEECATSYGRWSGPMIKKNTAGVHTGLSATIAATSKTSFGKGLVAQMHSHFGAQASQALKPDGATEQPTPKVQPKKTTPASQAGNSLHAKRSLFGMPQKQPEASRPLAQPALEHSWAREGEAETTRSVQSEQPILSSVAQRNKAQTPPRQGVEEHNRDQVKADNSPSPPCNGANALLSKFAESSLSTPPTSVMLMHGCT